MVIFKNKKLKIKNKKHILKNAKSFSVFRHVSFIFGLLFFILASHWSLAFGQGYVALDPTRHIPNARVLGLGKAYTALADDTASMYTNPAGAAGAENWQFSSMSGKFLNEFSYLSLSGFYPTPNGVFGIGYAGSSIGDAWATTIEVGSDPNDPLYTFDRSQPEMKNNNIAYVFSYAHEADKIRLLDRLPWADKISVGANLKIFNVDLTGDGIDPGAGTARGNELDLGVMLAAREWLTLGAVVQNILPTSMGGKLTYGSGHTESYPAVLEIGSAFNVLGDEDALRSFRGQELKVMLDMDRYPSISNYPTVWHLGAEWKPLPLIALRFGIDQDAIGDGSGGLTVVSDQAYGVGLYFRGFRFDYAYHTFAGSPGIDNHYFSLSYGIMAKEIPIKMKVYQPQDKLLTFDERVRVTGEVFDPNIQTLYMDGKQLKIGLRGGFETAANLKIGKNKLVLEGKSGSGRQLATEAIRILRLETFPDVPAGFWARQQISLLAMAGVVKGYPNKTFKPEGKITRAEMAALLMKTKPVVANLPAGKAGLALPFKDIPARHWAANYIAQAAAEKIVKGYPDKTFKPKGFITRAEGLSMIARFAQISQEAYAGQFPDVASKHWSAQTVSGAYRAGILNYLKGKPFNPSRNLTRAEAVEMLYRTRFMQDLLDKDLLNWKSY